MPNPDLILASKSPRRKELLAQIGVKFESVSADIDERLEPNETAEAFVLRLALEKAQAVAQEYPGRWVLGSDTAVVLADQILGKPADKADSLRMLQALSGQTHQVMTAVALVNGERQQLLSVTTDVSFRTIDPAEAERYWLSGEPCDKAGSYGIQGLGAVFVEHIAGSYSAVVGLPLQQTAQLLTRCGIPIWQLDQRPTNNN